jgi:hypothetical protein
LVGAAITTYFVAMCGAAANAMPIGDQRRRSPGRRPPHTRNSPTHPYIPMIGNIDARSSIYRTMSNFRLSRRKMTVAC